MEIRVFFEEEILFEEMIDVVESFFSYLIYMFLKIVDENVVV